jgi:hypothetical protein
MRRSLFWCLDDGENPQKTGNRFAKSKRWCIVCAVTEKESSNQPQGDCQMKMYDLIPQNERKSFYGKAKVEVLDDGKEILYSYNTPIVEKASDGTLKRLYFAEPSMTTCAHIRSFCGLDKKGFMKLA